MTQRTDRPKVGHREVVDRLVAAFDSTAEGPRSVLLAGRPGSGRRTCSEALIERLAEREQPFTQVRLRAVAADDGVRTLMRVFGSFVAGIARSKAFDRAADDLLEDAAESVSDERVQAWLTNVAGSTRSVRANTGGADFQIKLPPDNPWLALLFAFDVVGSRSSWVIDLHDLGAVVSPSFWVFLSALMGRARSRSWKMLFVGAPGPNIYGEQPEDAAPGPASYIRSLFSDAEVVEVPPLDLEAIDELIGDTYRPNSFPEGLGARLLDLSGGHPDTLHEVLDALEEDDTITWDDKGYSLSDLEDVDLDVLVPLPVEETGDAEEPEDEGDDDGKEALPEALMERILYVAAVEGQSFSASAVRTYLQASEDDVVDALDELLHILDEGEYHKALGTWTYSFRYRFWRDWYLDNPPAGFKTKRPDIARGLATIMMQSYAPAAFEYVPRAAQLFAEAGDGRGARNMLGMAIGADRPELLDFAIEASERFEDSPWPDGLVRLLYTRLADRAVNTAKIETATDAIGKARAWAEGAEDHGTLGWLKLLECRLSIRQGDFPAARRLGEEAHSTFEALSDRTRCGETLNQLAMVCLNMGDAKSAEAYVKRAQKASNIPPIKGHSQYILGLLLKRRGQVAAATTCFKAATTLSEQSGNLVLSLESMLNYGECALMTGKAGELAPVIERALEMSRALRSTSRERIASRLLCQAEAARGNHVGAFEMARHALDLTRELGLTDQESIDLYHCGLFAVLNDKKDEGLEFLTAARAAADKEGNKSLLPEILFNVGQVKMSKQDWEGSRGALEQALTLARERKDRVRELRILEHLGLMFSASGDHAAAVTRFKEATSRAVGPQVKQFRKNLRKRIAQEQSKAAASARAEEANPGDGAPA